MFFFFYVHSFKISYIGSNNTQHDMCSELRPKVSPLTQINLKEQRAFKSQLFLHPFTAKVLVSSLLYVYYFLSSSSVISLSSTTKIKIFLCSFSIVLRPDGNPYHVPFHRVMSSYSILCFLFFTSFFHLRSLLLRVCYALQTSMTDGRWAVGKENNNTKNEASSIIINPQKSNYITSSGTRCVIF